MSFLSGDFGAPDLGSFQDIIASLLDPTGAARGARGRGRGSMPGVGTPTPVIATPQLPAPASDANSVNPQGDSGVDQYSMQGIPGMPPIEQTVARQPAGQPNSGSDVESYMNIL